MSKILTAKITQNNKSTNAVYTAVKLFRILMGVIAVAALGISAFFLPLIADDFAQKLPEFAYLKIPVIVCVYIASAGVYVAVYMVIKICNNLIADKTFCRENLTYFKRLCIIAYVEIVWILLGAVGLFVGNALHPSVALCFIITLFLIVILLAFCKVMSQMLSKAIELKEENDYTI